MKHFRLVAAMACIAIGIALTPKHLVAIDFVMDVRMCREHVAWDCLVRPRHCRNMLFVVAMIGRLIFQPSHFGAFLLDEIYITIAAG